METAQPSDAPAASPAGPAAEFVSITEAARRLGLDKATVSRQARKLDVAKNDRGQIDLADYIAKREGGINVLMARGPHGVAMGGQGYGLGTDGFPATPPQRATRDSNLVKASAALKALQVEEARLDLEERKGLLIARAQVAEQLFGASRVLRDELLSLPDRLASELAALDSPDDIRVILTRRIEAALAKLHERLQRFGNGEPDQGHAS